MIAPLPLLCAITTLLGGPEPAQATPGADEVRQAIDRGLAFLVTSQNRDGSWGGARNKTFTDSFAVAETHHAWMVGTTGVVCMALLQTGRASERPALERGLAYIVANAELKRPAEWDVDNVWGLIFGLTAVSRALAPSVQPMLPTADALRDAGARLLRGLVRYQSPNGGWGYYAMGPAAWRPSWGTSFTTAAAVHAMLDAKEAGLPVDEKVLRAAVRAVRRCRLPSGSYTYSVMAVPRWNGAEDINAIQGSLSRIQCCNLALRRAGEPMADAELERGIALFFEHHKFLDAGLRKPIPHEAYYFVAAYFYLFGHYYAAEVIERFPRADRAALWPKLQREVLKTQESDGGFWDFWIASFTKPYGTAFGVMALSLSLER